MSKRWKYIQTTRPELYDLENDPGEQINLVETQPHRARILKDRLAQVLEQTVRQEKDQEETPLDAESLNHLHSLGYVGDIGVIEDFSFDRTKEDPKDLIGFHNEYRKLSNLAKQNKLADARALVERLLKQHTGFYQLYELASHIALNQNDYENAIRYGKKAVELESGHFKVHHILGLAYSQSKQNEAAIKQLELALEFMVKDQAASLPEYVKVLNALAWALVTCPNQELNDPSKALELAQKACELTQSKHPLYLNTLAVVYTRLDNLGEAVKTSQKAVALARAKGDQALITKLQKQLDLIKRAWAESK